jgi:hypothetical protein
MNKEEIEQKINEKLEIDRIVHFNLARGQERKYVSPKPRYVRPPSMMQLLKDVAALETPEEQIQRLIQNKHASLLMILRAATDNSYIWTVTDHPVVKPANKIECNFLYDTARRLYIWVEWDGHVSPVHDDAKKRGKLWQNFLEEHADDELQLLLLARRKVLLQTLGIPLGVVHDAFPELIPNSAAAAQEKADAPRRNARTLAEEERLRVGSETMERLRQIDEALRANEREHQNLMEERDKMFINNADPFDRYPLRR